jgi:hypothetical protein
MDAEIESAAARVLRACSTPSVSMRRLHALVVAEIGPEAGSYVRFKDAVRRRRDLFVVVDPDDPLGDGQPWPPSLLAEYRQALSAAGFDAEPVVVLTGTAVTGVSLLDDEPEDSVMGRLSRSLVDLLGPARRDPALERAIAQAVLQSDTMARAVTAADS